MMGFGKKWGWGLWVVGCGLNSHNIKLTTQNSQLITFVWRESCEELREFKMMISQIVTSSLNGVNRKIAYKRNNNAE
jgi:hypothetical protein